MNEMYYGTVRQNCVDEPLWTVLNQMTKRRIAWIASQIGLWVSMNHTKSRMARCLADGILRNPVEVLSRLPSNDLMLLDKLIQCPKGIVSEDKGIVERSMLHAFGLVVVLDDSRKIVLLNDVKKSLIEYYQAFLMAAHKES